MRRPAVALLLLSIAAHPFASEQASADPFGYVQFIHALADAGPVDIYFDDALFAEGVPFRAATAFKGVSLGRYKVSVYLSSDSLGAPPLVEREVVVTLEKRSVVAAIGSADAPHIFVRHGVRANSRSGLAEFFLIHAAPDTGTLDLRLRDPTKNNVITQLLYNNMPFGRSGIYYGVDSNGYNYEVIDAYQSRIIGLYFFNLGGFGQRTLVMVLSGRGQSTDEDVMLITYDEFGDAIVPVVTTGVEAVEPSDAFALREIYPNPFRGDVAIPYVLDKDAAIQLEIIDLLGRTVTTLAHGHHPAGAATARWDGRTSAGALAPSGLYFCRLWANGATRTRKILLAR